MQTTCKLNFKNQLQNNNNNNETDLLSLFVLLYRQETLATKQYYGQATLVAS